MTNRPARVLAALVAIAAVACGTTVPQRETAEGLDGGLGEPTAEGANPGATAIASEAPAVSDGVAGPAGEAPAADAPGETAPRTPNQVVDPRGSTSADRSPVEVGAYLLKNFDSFAGSAGRGAYASSFDQQAHASRLATEFNRRGGLAGRPLRLVFAFLDSTSADTFDAQEQAACEHFTRDHQVVVVLDIYVGFLGGLAECLRQRGVPLVESNLNVQAKPWYAAGPRLRFTLQTPVWDRAVDQLVDRLVARRLLTKSSRIGLLTFDLPHYRAHVNAIWKPALARHNLKLTDVAYTRFPASTAEIGPTAADLQGTVLRWKAQDIDVVLDDAKLVVTFVTAAQNQGYNPFYGVTTWSSPLGFTDGNGHRVGGIGWNSYWDTGAYDPPNAAAKLCKQLSGDAGGTNWESDLPGRIERLEACDAFAALARASVLAGSVTRLGLGAAFQQIGALQSGTSLGMRLDDRHPDGITSYRDIDFVQSCKCMKYTSPPRPLG